MSRWFQFKTSIDDEGRICTECKEYKIRSKFSRTTLTTTKRTPNCKECRNKRKAIYRQNNNRITDILYKEKTRKLSVWTIISFPSEEIKDIIDWNKDQQWKVIGYVNRKWHRLESTLNGNKRRLNTSLAKFRIQHKKVIYS